MKSANSFTVEGLDFTANQNWFAGAGMGTAEWIALGLLLIALVGWCRWRGTPEGRG
jgi:hypothetical protein